MTIAIEITHHLSQRASRPTWEKICDALDRCPADELDEAFKAIDAGLASWPDDLNAGNAWTLPPRQASKKWSKAIALGEPAPAGWPAITFLQLHDHRFGKHGSAPLFANPALATLTHLYLAQCGLGPLGLQQLLASPHLGALTRLVISGNSLGPGCAAALLATPLAQQLTMLDIGRNGLDISDLDALLATPLPNLTSLQFNHGDLTDDQLATLLHADSLPSLNTLQVGRYGSTLDRELARAEGGHPHIKRALWRGWLLNQQASALKDLAKQYAIPNAAKLSAAPLIDALHRCDP
jgi:hypothetical protein